MPPKKLSFIERIEHFLFDIPPVDYSPAQRYLNLQKRRPNIKQTLQTIVNDYTPRLNGGEIKISFYDLKGEYSPIHINANSPGWAASTIKIPVMISVFQEIDCKKIKINEELTINHRYPLEAYDSITNMQINTTIPINSLIYYMIRYSDNEATNMLADKISLEKINQSMQDLRATRTMMAHLLTPNVPRLYTDWNHEGSNLTTTNDLCTLLKAIYTNTAASHKSCKYMQLYLEHGDKGPLGLLLPQKTIIGSKMGYITDEEKGNDILDAGVINKDYIIVVACNKINHNLQKINYNLKKINPILPKYNILDTITNSTINQNTINLDTLDQEIEFRYKQNFANYNANRVISIISKVIYNTYYKTENE